MLVEFIETVKSKIPDCQIWCKLCGKFEICNCKEQKRINIQIISVYYIISKTLSDKKKHYSHPSIKQAQLSSAMYYLMSMYFSLFFKYYLIGEVGVLSSLTVSRILYTSTRIFCAGRVTFNKFHKRPESITCDSTDHRYHGVNLSDEDLGLLIPDTYPLDEIIDLQ